LGYTKTYAYDANRNLVSATDAEGQTITYAYDALNRLIQKTLPDNSTVSYKYDPMGNLLNIYAPRTLTIMEYDLLGRLKSSTSLVNTRQDEYADYVSLPGNTVIGADDTSYDNTDILIVDGAVVTIDGTHTFKNIAIINGGVLTHSAGSMLDITADTIAIDSTSRIDATGKGYAPGYTLGNTSQGAGYSPAGGSYGGRQRCIRRLPRPG
jgi:YD repeat-containing protein